MRIETVAEELVCPCAIATTDGAAGVVEGPAGYGYAKGDEGFFFEATGEFLPAVLFEEISRGWSAGYVYVSRPVWTRLSPSKEEGRGASDMVDYKH